MLIFPSPLAWGDEGFWGITVCKSGVRWPLAVASVVVTSGCCVLTIWLSVTVLMPLIAVASLGLSLLWRREVDGDWVARGLAHAMLIERQRLRNQTLTVAWQARPAKVGFRDPDDRDLPELVEPLLLQWQDTIASEIGSIKDAAAFYPRITSLDSIATGGD